MTNVPIVAPVRILRESHPHYSHDLLFSHDQLFSHDRIFSHDRLFSHDRFFYMTDFFHLTNFFHMTNIFTWPTFSHDRLFSLFSLLHITWSECTSICLLVVFLSVWLSIHIYGSRTKVWVNKYFAQIIFLFPLMKILYDEWWGTRQ